MHTDILKGVQRAFPIVLGYLPPALAFGILAVKSGVSPAMVAAMSLLVYAGSAQFVAIGLLTAGAGMPAIILTVFVVNLRHVLMSAALAPHFSGFSRLQRFLLGCELTDETFVLHSSGFQQGLKMSLASFFACNITAHGAWTVGTLAGALFGALISDVKPLALDYALASMYLALLVPLCRERLHVLVAMLALALSVGMSIAGFSRWNVIAATAIAATVGLLLLHRKNVTRKTITETTAQGK